MAEQKIILEFPNCWYCNHDVTVTQYAWRLIYPDDEKIPLTSIDKVVLPMTNYQIGVMMSLPSVPGIILHYDDCARCGMRRLVRVERTSIPGDAFAQMSGMQQPGKK